MKIPGGLVPFAAAIEISGQSFNTLPVNLFSLKIYSFFLIPSACLVTTSRRLSCLASFYFPFPVIYYRGYY